MNINDFDTLVKQSNIKQPTLNPSIGIDSFDAQVKKANPISVDTSKSVVRTPPGYIKQDLLSEPAPIQIPKRSIFDVPDQSELGTNVNKNFWK